MSASECSVVVRNQGALLRSIDEPVVPDPGGEGEQALSAPHNNTEAVATAVFFESELALEGVVDALDVLADPGQLAEAPPLVAAVRSDEDGRQVADEVLELPAGVPLVGHDEQASSQWQAREHGLGDLAIAELGIGQAPGRDDAVRGGEQVKAKAPEVARVGGAVAVVGPVGELGALDRLPRGAAGDRRGVEQADL